MKKLFLSFILMFSLCFLFTGCGQTDNSSNPVNPTPTECVHTYINTVTQPTCTTQGYTTHTCSKCNKTYTDTYTNPLGHNYEEGTTTYQCSRCDKYEDDGFTFQLITTSMANSNDAYKGRENTYDVKGISSSAVENGVITIPRKHLGYPVTGLYRGCLYNARTTAKEVRFNDNIKYIGSSLFLYDGSYSTPSSPLSLEKITFSSSCNNINISHSAFSFCKKVTLIQMPNGCFSQLNHDDLVGNHFLFEDTDYYKTNKVSENGLIYLNNMLLSSDRDVVGSNVTIRTGTYLVANYVFKDNTNIFQVTIPSSVKYIGNSAFANCLNLTTVNFAGTQVQYDEIIKGTNIYQNTSATVQCQG